MGRGSSGISGANRAGGGGGTTPSGVTYQQFMGMSDTQKYSTIESILDDSNIKVPSYLDDSDTTKVIYALGMNNATTVVTDAQLDNMQGREIFRTVYDASPQITSDMILDQIRNGEYTQMSGSGGSAHGRAIYFATDFTGSTVYGLGQKNPMVMRAKINSNANIRSEASLRRQMNGDSTYQSSRLNRTLTRKYSEDDMSLYALSHGIDGWYSGTYTMMVNRGALTASSQNKSIYSSGTYRASSWSSAPNR